MLPKDIIRKIQRIKIVTNRMVSDVFAGEYQSVFKGRGMEFEEVREYQPGDEVRDIDWNVTARMGRPFIKKFVEERELTLMLLVDLSGSSQFGTKERFKSELAAELCAVLAFSAIRNKDKVGLIVFTDRIEKFVPPAKGSRHVLRVIREVLYFAPKGRGTDIGLALQYLSKVARRQTVAFLISDFQASDFEKALRIAKERHDLVPVVVGDPREEQLPPIGLVSLGDPETGAETILDTSDSVIRDAFSRRRAEQREALLKLFRSSDMDSIQVSTGRPYEKDLLRFFRQRERKFR
ncbi:MAG: DUF58 domain-containing protein, partial [Candidatus Aureabacteria bacterium]|nr:DUF58 domain-containing protein [Candidatus Auribacterota bacterium]